MWKKVLKQAKQRSLSFREAKHSLLGVPFNNKTDKTQRWFPSISRSPSRFTRFNSFPSIFQLLRFSIFNQTCTSNFQLLEVFLFSFKMIENCIQNYLKFTVLFSQFSVLFLLFMIIFQFLFDNLRDWWNPISNLTFCLMLFAGRMAKSYFKQEHDLGKKKKIAFFCLFVGDLVNLIVFVEGWLIWK